MLFQQARHKLEQILETRNEILKVERSVRELYQLFIDFAALVGEQGDQLKNDIWCSVCFANDFSERGVNLLRQVRGAAPPPLRGRGGGRLRSNPKASCGCGCVMA